MTQAQSETRKFRQLAYGHGGKAYVIRWSPNAWTLNVVSGKTWTRIESGEQSSKPAQLRALIAMCELSSQGGKPGQLYSALVARVQDAVAGLKAEPILRSVPKPQAQPSNPTEPQAQPSKPARKPRKAPQAAAVAVAPTVDTKAPKYNREIVAEQSSADRAAELQAAAVAWERDSLGNLRGNPTWDSEARNALVASAAAAEAALEAARQALLAVKAIRLAR